MSASVTLGKLTRVDLRTAWQYEASDFTPWLAQEDNLAELAETLGMDLRVEAQEQSVGPYRADLLCVEPLSGHKVLIENQLEKTDHMHLGQIITYAAGLEAVTVVWIARQFSDEHRAAVDWLNTISGENYRFFALEIELWRIGDSAPAPKFNIVAKPNNWSKAVKTTSDASADTSWSAEYWSGFREVLQERLGIAALGKPSNQYYLRLARYNKDQVLYAYHYTRARRIGLQLWFGGPSWSAWLEQLKAVPGIEEKLGPIFWSPAKASGSAYFQINGYDARDRAEWPKQYDAMIERLKQIKALLDPVIPKLTDAPAGEAAADEEPPMTGEGA